MPQLMEQLGFETNEYGSYENHFRYHGRLLSLYFVFPPAEGFSADMLERYSTLFLYAALVVLVAAAFVLIIHSAFAMSAGSRIKQLGLFRSVGASPGQIRASVLFEGIAVSILPIAAGIMLGCLFSVLAMRVYTGILGGFALFSHASAVPARNYSGSGIHLSDCRTGVRCHTGFQDGQAHSGGCHTNADGCSREKAQKKRPVPSVKEAAFHGRLSFRNRRNFGGGIPKGA